MTSPWNIQLVLNPVMGVLIRDRRGDTDTEEKLREDGGRDGRDAATSPGMPGVPRSWKRQGGPSPGASEESAALPTP